MTRPEPLGRDLLGLLLPDAPERIVFGITPEREAAQCHLAARLASEGRILDVTRHRYAFSLGLAVAVGESEVHKSTAYAHYFRTPEGALLPVTTRHTPGVDDLGGLIQTRD